MFRGVLFCLFLCLISPGLVGQTSLEGKVTDEETNEAIIFCTIGLFKNGIAVSAATTDVDGNYVMSNLDPGTYDLLLSYTGYQEQKVQNIVLTAGRVTRLDVKMSTGGGVALEEILVVDYRKPLVEQDNTTSGTVVTSEEIRNLPTRNVNAIAATSAGATSADEGGQISIRGSRTNGTDIYIDGVRVQRNMLPESEIDQLQVITGGIEAKYGDVTGGIISITTKGPSSKFSGGVEVETSNLFDNYNNSLIGFNLNGPILKNALDQTILGFRVSGRYTSRYDEDPPAIDVFRIKEDKLRELEDNPIINIGGNPFLAADFLTNEDVDALDARPFEEQEFLNLNARLDAQLTKGIDVSLTGAFSNNSDRDEGFIDRFSSSEEWELLNSQNNPTQNIQEYRANFRFRHRFGVPDPSNPNSSKNQGLIRNGSYIIQGTYERTESDRADERHGDNVFNYGYVGNFNIEWVPTFESIFDPETQSFSLRHTDYRQVLRAYTPGEINPVLANYNKAMNIDFSEGLNGQIENYIVSNSAGGVNLLARDAFFAPNGAISNVFSDSWNFHNNVGTVHNQIFRRANETLTFNLKGSFDIFPQGSEKGRHNIELGALYEKRTNRTHIIRPRNIWDIARQQANNHILGIVEGAAETGDAIEIPDFGTGQLLELTIAESEESQFFRKIRESLGVPLDQYVNVDGLSPDQLNLAMFSARELADQQVLDYWGYDYLGNEFNGSFEDFFTTTDPSTGLRTFPVAANEPIYMAGYIQDKFTFKDIIFRVGVRVDNYDANTKVLKDNYSLYEIMGAGQYHSEFGGSQPGNIGNDYKVYLDDTQTSVQAYRDGDQWYRADGTPVNSSIEIEGIRSGLVFPRYASAEPNDNPNFIKSPDFDVNASFTDYEAQLNIMPRLAFSFPISEQANFFSHYDILVQRPPSNTLATALDYFYFIDRAGTLFNNPNLLPEKTINYEVGFQQRLSDNSALKLAAYYREMRDMIQQRTFFPVPFVNQYTTYDNQDFGTVKGFSMQYDLRKSPTSNFSLQANYTVQFADGTGSDANSQRGLTSRGNLRTLFPLSFDERHRIVATLDYRFDKDNYNGPKLFDLDIFAGAGANLQMTAVSGRPYTATETPTELGGNTTVGSINGARRPWNFTVNLRIDKSFKVQKNLYMNVYLRVSNLLDRRNIINVYSATGSPTDDGFLRSANGQDQIDNILSSQRILESYLSSYQWRLLDSDFFTLPRRMFLGAIMEF